MLIINIMPTREQKLAELKISALQDINDRYLTMIYNYRTNPAIPKPSNKKKVLLDFINYIFTLNKQKTINKIEDFVGVNKKLLVVNVLSKEQADAIFNEFNIDTSKKISKPDNYGLNLIKSMIKQLELEGYLCINVRKDDIIMVNGVKKTKYAIEYSIVKKHVKKIDK
jgi:hypothetical protein